MKKCMVCLFAVLLFVVGCMDEGNESGASFEDVQSEDAWQCKTHAECFEHGHSFCSAGTCVGDPQPEILPEEDVTADTEEMIPCEDWWYCPAGSGCESGVCVEKTSPACTDDSDCAGKICQCKDDLSRCVNVVCENNVCTKKEFTEEDCSSGCENGLCNDVECISHTECPLGYSCNNGQCMQNASPECVEDADCGTGISCECKQGSWIACTKHKCENYECVDVTLAEQCEFGCEGGQCLPEKPDCESDADCADLNSTTCDGVWLLTVEGQCYKGKCEANNVSGFACLFGCADGACLSDPEVPECLTDADCAEGATNVCADSFLLKSTWQFPKCVDGVCEKEVVNYNCTIPCQVGCYECWKNSDCDDGDACTADYCGDHECMYENACACKADANCDDGNACTQDACENGTCVNQSIDGCVQCQADGSCGGVATGCYGNSLMVVDNHCNTLGYCLANSIVCEFGCDIPIGCKDECENNGNCDDGNVCTKDVCAEGKCSHEDKCLYGEYEDKLACKMDADCVGTEFGNYCVATVGEMGLCQPCLQKLTGDVGCAEGEVCHWGLATISAGESEYFVSTYTCSECTLDSQCNDGNACTEDKCDYFGQCENTFVKGCEVCAADADCDTNQICDSVGVDTEYTWTGQCKAGKCEVLKKECLTACVGEACEKLECESDADCFVGQFCNEDYKCGWDGKELQCKFECPIGKKFAWVMSAKPDEAVESGTGIFKVSPTTLCMWGWKNPAFKFNCWDGANVWSEGDKAVVTCNEENFTVAPDENYGSQGVMVVTFTNVYCGF